jgi:hypothetical protein
MLEKHVQTILISLITGSIVYAFSYFLADKSDKAILTTQLQAISVQVAELRTEVRSNSTNFATKENIADHEARLRIVERKVLK